MLLTAGKGCASPNVSCRRVVAVEFQAAKQIRAVTGGETSRDAVRPGSGGGIARDSGHICPWLGDG